jgi:hypothetical protein
MTTDGSLRPLFQKHIPNGHWQSVETWSTGQGVPDANYCIEGAEGWCEMKVTNGFVVIMRPHQISWIERRRRAGGRVFIAVRRKAAAGPRRGAAADQLWLFNGDDVRKLDLFGIDPRQAAPFHLAMWDGGPARWDWLAIKSFLVAPQ